ncbi:MULTISPECIES: glutamate--tRNA ligase [Caproicibacterium]|uniref:Glutamate--tRNA ligase n=1 Tax=Caproicibacterium argilliputei TaxID=3030016 RepID=A0AA97DAC7_9FIRM|nr:glutamate--tRNA ligase [Caproicibacterium argilliputei]WOC33169.1 glutamate--tRNA ligase [Caproicibacterium argilliputei]
MENQTVRTRFAPSPTGFMHVGNLRTALYEYLIAKSQGGTFVLRIEDTDQERLVEGATDVIYHTLQQVGLKHDEGPDIGGPYGPYVQSKRKALYLPYAQQLVKEGKAYYCFCSKERLASLHDENGLGGYDRHCRDLPQEEVDRLLQSGTPWVIRQKMPLTGSTTFTDSVFGEITIENSELEDQILIKSDGYPTYNFANVIDDHLMHITHVVRGCEYLTSTPKYNLLYEAFGWQLPTYVHLPLIMGRNADGSTSKLSKRHGSTGFADLLREGYLPEAIINYIALLGWAPQGTEELFTLDELAQQFRIHGISKSPAVFDYDKLTWMNGEYLKKMPQETFIEKAMPYFREVFGDAQKNWKVLAEVLQPRVLKLTDLPDMLAFFKKVPPYTTEIFVNKKSKANLENAPVMLEAAIADLQALDDWSVDALHEDLLALAKKLEVKNGVLLWPVRVAAAGQTVTPGGAMEILSVLGKDESLRRLRAGLEMLRN